MLKCQQQDLFEYHQGPSGTRLRCPLCQTDYAVTNEPLLAFLAQWEKVTPFRGRGAPAFGGGGNPPLGGRGDTPFRGRGVHRPEFPPNVVRCIECELASDKYPWSRAAQQLLKPNPEQRAVIQELYRQIVLTVAGR